jgi:hypothetical protein
MKRLRVIRSTRVKMSSRYRAVLPLGDIKAAVILLSSVWSSPGCMNAENNTPVLFVKFRHEL